MLTFFDLATDGSGGEVKAPSSGEAEGSAGGRFERKDVWDMRWSTVHPPPPWRATNQCTIPCTTQVNPNP